MWIALNNCIINSEIKHILIHNDKIVKISSERYMCNKTYDLAYRKLIPGGIDAHVHVRDFDLSQQEDIVSCSRAAVKGGITTIIDMPNTKPETITIDAVEKKNRSIKNLSAIME